MVPAVHLLLLVGVAAAAFQCPTWEVQDAPLTTNMNPVMEDCEQDESACYSLYASDRDGKYFEGGCGPDDSGKHFEDKRSHDTDMSYTFCKTSGCMPKFPAKLYEDLGIAPPTDGPASTAPEMSGLLAGIVVYIFVNF